MRNLSLYLRIGLVMVVSFLFANIFSNSVFIAGTPNLQPWIAGNPLVALVYKPRSIQPDIPQGGVNSSVALAFADVPYTKVGQGVFAKEKGADNYVLVKVNDIEYKEYTFIVRGKAVKIRVPKDDQPPAQKEVEKIVQ